MHSLWIKKAKFNDISIVFKYTNDQNFRIFPDKDAP